MSIMRVVGLKEESTFDEKAGSAPDFYHNGDKISIKLDTKNIRGTNPLSRGAAKGRPGTYTVKSSVDYTANLAILAYYFKAALGEYNHEEVEGKQVHESWGENKQYLPSFTLWGTFDDKMKEVTGCVLDNLKLEIKVDEFLKGTVEWVGANQEILKEGLPNASSLNLFDEEDLSFLDIAVEIGEPAVKCIVNSTSIEIKNSIKADGRFGVGSRKAQGHFPAQDREIGLNIESFDDPEMYDLINAAEHGDITLNTPSACKIYSIPVKYIFSICGEQGGSSLEIQFPDAEIGVEYEASGKEDISVKMAITPVATKEVTLNDGATKVITDMYTKLLNDVPEINAE